MLPAVMAGRYIGNGGAKMMGLFVSTCLASLFVFFCLVALQGVLLNIVPARHFPRVSLFVQGALFIALLGLLPLALSISGQYRWLQQRPEILWSLPPVWFLGLGQAILGNTEPLASDLGWLAMQALGASVALAMLTYVWSYRRHRVRVLETQVQPQSGAGWMARLGAGLAERSMPDPRERGIFSFVAATLGRSRQHRMVLTAFVALAGAVVVQGFLSLFLGLGFRGWEVKTFALRQAAVSAPLALSLFGLAGFRYLFRLPVELRANWLFRINEGGNRETFLRAVDRFLLWWGVIPAALVALPLEIAVFGPAGGIAAAVMCLLPSMILQELLLLQFQRIPFTSAYLPGKRPLVETVIFYGVGVAIYVSVLGAITVSCLEEPSYFLVEFGILLASGRGCGRPAMRIGSSENSSLKSCPSRWFTRSASRKTDPLSWTTAA